MTLILNPIDITATYRGDTVSLTPREFQILRYLVAARRPVKGPELSKEVFGEYYRTDAVGPYISRIRKKLQGVPTHTRAGYMVFVEATCPTCGKTIDI